MKTLLPGARQAVSVGLTLLLVLAVTRQSLGAEGADTWTAAQRSILMSLHLDTLAPAPADPTNAVESLPRAAALGKRLFFDTRLSANQRVSCASCHNPEANFQDGRALGQGIATGLRRTMPVVESGRGPWQFWDGRKDSVWAQALGPLEDALEHGGNRLAFARVLANHYRGEYEGLFGPMPDLDGMPEAASPLGNNAERQAWGHLSSTQQTDISRVFSNIGKAIASYEKTLQHTPSRLDTYLAATARNAPEANSLLAGPEKRGLKLFIGKGGCVTCHAGPLFSDQYFHNTGVAPRVGSNPDRGRSAAIAKVLADEFNCLGPFSDAKPEQCQELNYIAHDDPHMLGAFKTPGLRNVALRAPYMHAGQITTLPEVIRHYANAPRAAVGHNERQPTALTDREIEDIVSFLGTLSSVTREVPPTAGASR